MKSIIKHKSIIMPRGSVSRTLAVLIAICYLLQPMHAPIKLAMHTFSHLVEKPAQLITHNEVSSADASSFHYNHQHQYHQADHQHGLIDFLDALLSGEKKDQKGDQSLAEIVKIDKHTVVPRFIWENFDTVSERSIYKAFSKETRSGYLKDLFKPPAFT